jgi:hypothetical protein
MMQYVFFFVGITKTVTIYFIEQKLIVAVLIFVKLVAVRVA